MYCIPFDREATTTSTKQKNKIWTAVFIFFCSLSQFVFSFFAMNYCRSFSQWVDGQRDRDVFVRPRRTQDTQAHSSDYIWGKRTNNILHIHSLHTHTIYKYTRTARQRRWKKMRWRWKKRKKTTSTKKQTNNLKLMDNGIYDLKNSTNELNKMKFG